MTENVGFEFVVLGASLCKRVCASVFVRVMVPRVCVGMRTLVFRRILFVRGMCVDVGFFLGDGHTKKGMESFGDAWLY